MNGKHRVNAAGLTSVCSCDAGDDDHTKASLQAVGKEKANLLQVNFCY